jgi:hypothetical protein
VLPCAWAGLAARQHARTARVAHTLHRCIAGPLHCLLVPLQAVDLPAELLLELSSQRHSRPGQLLQGLGSELPSHLMQCALYAD